MEVLMECLIFSYYLSKKLHSTISKKSTVNSIIGIRLPVLSILSVLLLIFAAFIALKLGQMQCRKETSASLEERTPLLIAIRLSVFAVISTGVFNVLKATTSIKECALLVSITILSVVAPLLPIKSSVSSNNHSL